MLEAMDKYFAKDIHWTHPEGGMFIWVKLPKGIDAVELGKKPQITESLSLQASLSMKAKEEKELLD